MDRKYFIQDNKNKKIYYFNDIVMLLKTKDIDKLLDSLDDIQIFETTFHADLLADTEKKGYEIISFDSVEALEKAIKKIKVQKIMKLIDTHKDKNKAGVYTIYNDTLKFIYVGSTSNFESRLSKHIYQKYVGEERLLHPDTKFEIIKLDDNNDTRLKTEEEYILKNVNNGLLNKHLYPFSKPKK